jgi:hypothetical protein
MECPSCIVDPSINREHHRYAIAHAMLGPANPSLPNVDFWKELAKRWEVGLPDALSRRCNNCEHYIDTELVQDCIQRHGAFDITSLGSAFKDMGDASGYCTLYDITCTASRVCVDWEAGGPITTSQEGDNAMESMANDRADVKKMSAKQKKISRVMREFKAGTLKSSTGQPITNYKQAVAVALSEAGMSMPKKDASEEYMRAFIRQVLQEEHAMEGENSMMDSEGKD